MMKPMKGWKRSGGILGPLCDDEDPGWPMPPSEPFWEKAALVVLGAVTPIAAKVLVAKLWPELFEEEGEESPLADEV